MTNSKVLKELDMKLFPKWMLKVIKLYKLQKNDCDRLKL